MGAREQSSRPGPPGMNFALAAPPLIMAGVLALLLVYRTIIRIRHHRRLKDIVSRNDQSQYTRTSPLWAKLKQHALYAPLWSTRHSREFQLLGRFHMGTLPLRIEFAFMAGYVGLNLIFFLVLIDWSMGWAERMTQLRFAAGHLAVMNTPALVLTAGRNNPLIPLLGIPFDAFNFVHRWIGRIITAEAVLHMSCAVSKFGFEYGWKKTTELVWHDAFFIYGLVAVFGFVLIFFQAMSIFRHAWYEMFLHLHAILAVMAFVGVWYHLEGKPQQKVPLVTLPLWGLDRLWRLASIIWRNFGRRRTTATVELLPGAVARVDVAVAHCWTFKPGQYMYLYIPSLGLWTSHPFSVAWMSAAREEFLEKCGSDDLTDLLLQPPERNTMSFLIKGRDGFTNKLLKKAMGSVDDRFEVTALAEGPFGGLHSLASYGTVVLIAGGIGITHPVSYLEDFMHGFSTNAVATRKVTLIWIIRSLDHLCWIQSWMETVLNHPALDTPRSAKHPSQSPNRTFSLSIHIYTMTPQYSTDEYVTGEAPWAQMAPPSVPVSFHVGKPCFATIVDAERKDQVGAMTVTVCGPGSLNDDVRQAVREGQGERTVDFYEESFSW